MAEIEDVSDRYIPFFRPNTQWVCAQEWPDGLDVILNHIEISGWDRKLYIYGTSQYESDITEDPGGVNLELNKEQVKKLISALQEWVDRNG